MRAEGDVAIDPAAHPIAGVEQKERVLSAARLKRFGQMARVLRQHHYWLIKGEIPTIIQANELAKHAIKGAFINDNVHSSSGAIVRESTFIASRQKMNNYVAMSATFEIRSQVLMAPKPFS